MTDPELVPKWSFISSTTKRMKTKCAPDSLTRFVLDELDVTLSTRTLSKCTESQVLFHVCTFKLQFVNISFPILALNIVNLESNLLMPVTEKSQLNISCSIVGSKSLQVTWYKDGSLINFKHSIERQLSERVISIDTQATGHYMAELYIERVDILDSGRFTCQVRDWGFVVNRTIAIQVNVLAQPTVSPLTATVWDGARVVVTCFSREDAALCKYGYNWLKNGQILNPLRENEHIEDLYPTGSRVLIYKATRSASYTCLATTPAGTAFRESRITVVPRFNVSGNLS